MGKCAEIGYTAKTFAIKFVVDLRLYTASLAYLSEVTIHVPMP